MSSGESRPRAGAILSLPMSGLLVVLFFMPWLRLSCDPGAVISKMEAAKVPPLPADAAEPKEIAHASGWQLARGRLSPAGDFAHGAGTPENPEFPRPRYWAYLGLAMPVLLAILAWMRLSGSMSPAGAGKLMLALGIGGVILMLVASSIDYVDDALEQGQQEMARNLPGAMNAQARNALDQSVDEARKQMKDFLKTRTTWYLWGSLGLYALVAGCGLLSLAAREPGGEERTEWARDDVLSQPAPPGPSPKVRHAPPETPGGLPDFGPDITPPIPSKTNSPAKFRTD